ncbi:MAG: ATP-grasp domain-containing protein, partial [Pseudomonadota bacterium]
MTNSNLTWVVQDKAFDKSDFDALRKAVEASNARFEALQIIPFSHEPIDAVPPISGKCIVYGSSGLLSLGHKLAWTPCGWDGQSFSQRNTIKKLKDLALNSDGLFGNWSEIASLAHDQNWQEVFVRPDDETKVFPGRVLKVNELEKWLNQLQDTEYLKENNNAALIAPIQAIGREWRIFFVGGSLVSACQYARAGQSERKAECPLPVMHFAKSAVEKYRPAECFVMDVVELQDEMDNPYRVVEFNSINSAGFYACNI